MTSINDVKFSILKPKIKNHKSQVFSPDFHESTDDDYQPNKTQDEEFDEMVQRIEEMFNGNDKISSHSKKTAQTQNSQNTQNSLFSFSNWNIFSIFKSSLFGIATILIPILTCALLSSLNFITINYLEKLYKENTTGVGADPIMISAILLSSLEILRCYFNLNFRKEFKKSVWKEFLMTSIFSILNSSGIACLVYKIFPTIEGNAINLTRYLFLLPTTFIQSLFQIIFPTKNKKILQIIFGIIGLVTNLGFISLYIFNKNFEFSTIYQSIPILFIGIQYLPNYMPFLTFSKNFETSKNALGILHEIFNIIVFIIISTLNKDVLRKGADFDMYLFIGLILVINFLSNIFVGILLGANRRKTFYFMITLFVPLVSSIWIYFQEGISNHNFSEENLTEIISLAVGLVLGIISISFSSLYLLLNDYGENMSDDAMFFTYSRYSSILNYSLNYGKNIRKFFENASDYEKLTEKSSKSKLVPDDNSSIPHIYVCPTFYKEDAKEMKTLCRSLIRMDRSSLNHKKYTFETHIWFDNVMDLDQYDADTGELIKIVNNHVGQFNSWVHDLVKVLAGKGFYLFNYVETPYGVRLEYHFPKNSHKTGDKTKLCVHLKDQRKIQRGKRWSQCCYMYYFMVHKEGYTAATSESHKNGLEKLKNKYILALDADIDFKAKDLNSALSKARSDPNIGIV